MGPENNITNPIGVGEELKKLYNGNPKLLYNDKGNTNSLRFDHTCKLTKDIDLGPPNGLNPPNEEENIAKYYKALQNILLEKNMQMTEDRTSQPRTHFTEDDVTIAILSSPVQCFSILINGGNKSRGNILLIMSTTWLEKRQSGLNPNQYSLYIHKGITFDADGCTFVDTFKPARRVTYFMNLITNVMTMGNWDDGKNIGVGLDCPMSSSVPLLLYTNNNLWTRLLIAKTCPSCYYPDTLAFIYKPLLDYAQDAKNIMIITLESKDNLEVIVNKNVEAFFRTIENKENNSVVIKTSSTILTSALHRFMVMTDRQVICEALIKALQQVSDGDYILVEKFYDMKMKAQNAVNEFDGKKPRYSMENHSLCLRAICCRGFGNNAVCSMLICGIRHKSEQKRGGNMVLHSLDSTLVKYGLGEEERDAIINITKKSAEELLFAIMEQEKNIALDKLGTSRAQTDILGIEFVLSQKDKETIPIIIKVEGHDCIVKNKSYDYMNLYLQGQCVGPLVNTMIERSLLYIMTDKKILVIGAGGASKNFVWDVAKVYSVKVILVDDSEDCPAATKVDKFLYYNYTNHREDAIHAQAIAELIRSQGLEPAGCCTIWEDCGPLTAMVSDQLGLCGAGTTGAIIARSKRLTQSTLYKQDEDIAHYSATKMYASRIQHISNIQDIDQALRFVGLPAMIKLEHGTSALGTYFVNDIEQCKKIYQEVQNNFKSDADHPGFGLSFGKSMIVMEYLDGTEHDIDLIVYKRRLVASVISDNGPTRDGRFIETAACMPSCLPEDSKRQMISAAYNSIMEIGLSNGVFNVEMKLTKTGPKVIEVNARMAGFYFRDWVKRCYSVDVLLCVFMLSCGVCPYIPKIGPKCQILGVMTVPSAHSHLYCNPEKLAKIEDYVSKGIVFKNAVKTQFEDSEDARAYEVPICNYAVSSENITKAKATLLKFCNEVGIDRENYDVEDFFSDFKQHRTIFATE